MFNILILLLGLLASTAMAQTCPTRPSSDSSNACANTAFVGNSFASVQAGPLTIGKPPGGYVVISGSPSPHTGYISWYRPNGTRVAFLGNDPIDNSLTLDMQGGVFFLTNGSMNATTINMTGCYVYGVACLTASQPMSLNATSTLRYGYIGYGDSITEGLGATTVANSYMGILQTDYGVNTPTFTNYGVTGYTLADMQARVFNTLTAPVGGANPLVSMFIGANDVTYIGNALYATSYKAMYTATAAFSGISASLYLSGTYSGNVLTGSWSTDTTYSSFSGKTTTDNAATYSVNAYSSSGVLYLYYGSYLSSGGTFTVAINGTPVADQITGNTVMTSQPPVAFLTSTGLTRAVAAARYIVPANTLLTVQITVTSASGAGNPVSIYGVATPPSKLRGISAPKVFLAGAIRQPDDTNSAATAILNATNKYVATTLAGDGLNVNFVDIRAYLNQSIDMANVVMMNCAAVTPSWAYGHPNDCGHRHIAQAFEDAINAAPVNYFSTFAQGGGGLAGAANYFSFVNADSIAMGLISGATRAIRLGADSTSFIIGGVNNTGTAFTPLVFEGSTLSFHTNGSTPALNISAGQVIQLPAVTTGTPAASLCLDASGNIIKKTTAGACI